MDCALYGCNNIELNKFIGAVETYICGYWTSTSVAGNNATVWRIDRDGALFDNYADNATYYGFCPVITVSKSIIS